MPVVGMTGKMTHDTLPKNSDVTLDASVNEESLPAGSGPPTPPRRDGDALAVALTAKRGFKHDDFAQFIPAAAWGVDCW